jgi:hypothetical protein
MPQAADGFKLCTQCQNTKPVDQFYPSKINSDGLYSWCKSCVTVKSHISRQSRQPREATVTSKFCPDCGETKAASEFYISRFVGPDGLSYCCRPCMQERNRQRAGVIKVSEPIRPANGLKVCPGCQQAKPFHDFSTNRRRKDHLDVYCKECTKRPALSRYFKHRYGISLEEYEAMLKKQDGRCAICRQEESHIHMGKVSRLAVDHDPTTAKRHSKHGKARELLCEKCNRAVNGLEHFMRSGLHAAAVSYLQKHGVNNRDKDSTL